MVIRGVILQLRYRDRLQVRAEGKKTAVAILHYKLSRAPWHVAKFSREFHASRRILGVKPICIFNVDVRVEQLVRIFAGVGYWGFGTPPKTAFLKGRTLRADRQTGNRRLDWCQRRDSNSQTPVSKTGRYSNSRTLALLYEGMLAGWEVTLAAGTLGG